MKIIKINKNKISKEEIDLIVDYFNSGKIVVYPTDTIYGIGCDATNVRAIKKIRKMKKSDPKKPLLILVNSYKMLKNYYKISSKQIKYLRTLWPGRISVILEKGNNLSAELTGGMSSIGVRMPDNDFLYKILKKVGKPIVSTSVNISFQENLQDVSDIGKYFKIKPDLVVDVGPMRRRRASKIVDIRDMADIKILRK